MNISNPPDGEELRLPLTIRKPSRLGWDDLVYPPETRQQLLRIAPRWRNRQKVLVEWGLSRRIANEGLNVLFTGEPGTGKSEAAMALGKELGLEVFQAQLAALVSKYIGETEKNLAAIFDIAELHADRIMLVFDEGDALFGKRSSDPKGSGERAQNAQTNYLLARLETFSGLLVVTTNLSLALDPAFTRRFGMVVTFDVPDREQQARIFKLALASAPHSLSLEDLQGLAEHAKSLTGGAIQCIASDAMFLAAEEAGNEVTLGHLAACMANYLERAGTLVPAKLVALKQEGVGGRSD